MVPIMTHLFNLCQNIPVFTWEFDIEIASQHDTTQHLRRANTKKRFKFPRNLTRTFLRRKRTSKTHNHNTLTHEGSAIKSNIINQFTISYFFAKECNH